METSGIRFDVDKWKYFKKIVTGFVYCFLITGCDSERDKQWNEWRAKTDRISYRCGMFGPYEFKVDRKYLFFWPTYEGRSDWEVQGPPPIGCDAKLSSFNLEAYWPGLSPAGRFPIEVDPAAEHINIQVESVINRNRWDLADRLKWKLHLKEDSKNNVGRYDDELGLFYLQGVDSALSRLNVNYYWKLSADGGVSIFIECGPIYNGKAKWCRQTQFLPKMRAVLDIYYDQTLLTKRTQLTHDVIEFINSSSTLKEN